MSDPETFYPPNNAPFKGSPGNIAEQVRAAGHLTFTVVEDRLVEALLTLWRLPDRERGLLRARASDGPWHLVMPEPGDYDARGGDRTSSDVAIRPAALTRREVAEMEEALGWVEVLDPADRKLVGLALAQLARGRREVSWVRMLPTMGLTRGSDGLRMRYGRAISAICAAQSGGSPSRSESRG